jgi:hypothetical protein
MPARTYLAHGDLVVVGIEDDVCSHHEGVTRILLSLAAADRDR